VPIYEFYCAACHKVFNFLARTINTEKRPACPRCGRTGLDRWMSSFAISKNRQESDAGDDLPPDMNEAEMERVMEDFAREAESMDENDPRQMARVLRKLYDKTGMPLDESTAEAIRRMEAGEDPESLDESLGDAPDDDTPDLSPGGRRLRGFVRKRLPPEVDPTLYDL
jgi:putative FmdB family regulatory protein